ncbi:YhjD/YihY/BrkB family envelope integrity protein [Leptospira ilyithenensis]|uniref:Ribonuclease BN n=1 Tax=Leptospira ilyithenensis TaxID=2484901 RepID=A0A4R9LRU4_9LEPT|nr:YhjD/YihY/BrkB family envelope integrity protein [Leptospira ilyithenensis]TGN13981.1 ribonuclease BN [Leptospira ilyithenensis]
MNTIPAHPLLIKITTIPENPGWKRKLILSLRILLVSIHRFTVDDCLMKASGLAYTTIVTLVPTLTVAFALLTVASGIQTRQDEIFHDVNSFLLKNNIQFDITPYWETLSDIINTASQIGAIGFIVFIFSATAVLRSLEKTFHSIWRIESHRSFINKFVFYFFLITFGPLIFVVGKGMSDKISDSIRPPHLKSIVYTEDGKIWVAGDKGNIGTITDLKEDIRFIPNDAVDYENMLCVDFNLIETGTCKKPNIYKENFFRIRSSGNYLYTISEEGSFLFSHDLGKNWNLHSFKNIFIKDFGISNDNTVFILTEDTRTLRYDIGSKLQELKRFTDKSITPVKVRFFTDIDGFILDKEGRLWRTTDGGTNFTFQVISKKTLNDIFFLDRNTGFVVGDNGAIFRSKDGGNTWQDFNHKKHSYERVWMFKSPKIQDYDLFVLNSLGDILISEDEGSSWSVAYKSKGGDILDLIHLSKQELPANDKASAETTDPEDQHGEEVSQLNERMLGIVGVGEYKKLIRIENDSKGNTVWKKYQGGAKVFSLYFLFQIILPLITVWLFFLMLYTLIPNTKVPLKAASIGAAITGIILILFFWGFLNIYITSFTEKTMLIYKALAAIPIFLLTIYCFGLIVLFGAEVTATLQFPDRYLLPSHPFEDIDTFVKHEFYHAIRFMANIYDYQDKKGKLISVSELGKKMMIPTKDLSFIQSSLEKADFISISDKGKISPVKLKEQITLLDLYNETVSFTLGAPPDPSTSLSMAGKELQSIESGLKERLGSINLKQLLT